MLSSSYEMILTTVSRDYINLSGLFPLRDYPSLGISAEKSHFVQYSLPARASYSRESLPHFGQRFTAESMSKLSRMSLYGSGTSGSRGLITHHASCTQRRCGRAGRARAPARPRQEA